MQCFVLPASTTKHTTFCAPQEFNKGLFDYLIATDDVHGSAAGDAAAAGGAKQQRRKGGGGKEKGGMRKKDEEFGVTRGIDFKVRAVISWLSRVWGCRSDPDTLASSCVCACCCRLPAMRGSLWAAPCSLPSALLYLKVAFKLFDGQVVDLSCSSSLQGVRTVINFDMPTSTQG